MIKMEKNIKIKYKENKVNNTKGIKYGIILKIEIIYMCLLYLWRFKSIPRAEIKNIQEKCKSMENINDNIIVDNQHKVETIQNELIDIK